MNARRGISGRDYAYSIEDHLLQAGDASYQYDADGFLASKRVNAQTTLYKYSSRGELLRVDLPDGRVIEYINDPQGRRIAKKINGAIVEKYLWQGLTRLLAIYDGNNALPYRFTYADDRTPTSVTTAGATYYMHYDQVGTLRTVTDAAGAVVKEATYDSFGNVLSDSRPTMHHFAFAGGLYDADTGLVRFGYRDYDANVGVWTAKDPIGFEGGDVNVYMYVWSSPIDKIDKNGLYSCVYVVDEHRMICMPNDRDRPSFNSNNYVSGQNNTPCPNNDCRDNPSRQNIPSRGPLPMGNYTIGTMTAPGSSRRNLTPSPSNSMHGRSGFQTHGCRDRNTCSEGCIAATTNNTRDEYNRLMSQEEGNNSLMVIPSFTHPILH
jgi:RHS repeat-associated protein